MVIDASIWVSRDLPMEAKSTISARWLRRQIVSGIPVSIPNLALAEVAGAIARRWREPERGLAAVRVVLSFPALQTVPIDDTLGVRAAELAARLFIKGSDAIYVALAERLRVPLATWDTEVLARAQPIVTTVQPS